MADHITIGDVAPRIRYSGDGTTTDFTYPFPIFTDEDLVVYIDDALQTLSTDYTVSGAGESTGGLVSFTDAPADGSAVTLVRQLTIQRTSDFQASGEFRAKVINDELDYQTAVLQQLADDITRSIRLSDEDSAESLVLPSIADRSGRLLSFDENGELTVSTPNSDTYITLSAFAETLIDDLDAASARATLGAQADLDVPSQAEAEAGTATTERVWTAERIGQAIAALSTGGTQIQPIGAAVASNALTISASELTLDFRSTTLGDGTITTVTGTPANLTISSGSTLGTTNAVQSDIAVLAINNAGTIELAAVNLAGGVTLTETGLISTTAEGGAGAADSATTIYSTSARSNVAYRVLGIVRSTQATAGTWATAPSLVQGSGGQAVTSLNSLGFGQTYSLVTGSRAVGTTYYNTTGKPIVVTIRITSIGVSHLIYVNGTEAAAALPNYSGQSNSLTAIVPPGGAYYLNTGTFNAWSELR